MKLKGALAVFVLLICLLSCVTLKPDVEITPPVTPVTATPTAINLSDSADSNKILSARFLNMLNHNFVYGDDFLYIDEIVNLSTLAMLEHKDAENPEFIDENIVFSYIFDMYGIEISDASSLNEGFPKKDGFIYIIPRGFTVYKHQNASVTVNEDGSFTVVTEVSIDQHDGESETYTATSLFVRNEKSAFGYNLISSKILETSLKI